MTTDHAAAAAEYARQRLKLNQLCDRRLGDTAAAETVRRRMGVAFAEMAPADRAAAKRPDWLKSQKGA